MTGLALFTAGFGLSVWLLGGEPIALAGAFFALLIAVVSGRIERRP